MINDKVRFVFFMKFYSGCYSGLDLGKCEGCPIHPTRVDSSMKCTIMWIRLNRHESSPLLSIRDTGSQFAQDLEYLAQLGFGVGRNVVDSIRFGQIVTNRLPCCRFVIPEIDLRRLKICSATGVLGWLENVVDSCRFDRINMNHILCCRFIIPEVDLSETGVLGWFKLKAARHGY